MYCPKCANKAKVERTLYDDFTQEVFRQHKCPECGHVFYSIEFEVEGNKKFKELWNKLHREYREGLKN